MQDSEVIIRVGMAKAKITTIKELSERLGLSRPTLTRKIQNPKMLTLAELLAMKKLFGWDDEQMGNFIRSAE